MAELNKKDLEFLETYSDKGFGKFSITVDIVLFTIADKEEENLRKNPEKELKVLMVQRDQSPYENQWTAVGTFLQDEETLEESAKRVLKDKVDLDNIYIEQLYTFGALNRDPRTRILSISYMALVDKTKIDPKIGKNIKNFKWINYNEIDNLNIGFDHKEIIKYGRNRLKNKVEYTDIAFDLLPEKFTVVEARKVFEILTGKEFQNFRRDYIHKFEELDEKTEGKMHKKARYFKLKK